LPCPKSDCWDFSPCVKYVGLFFRHLLKDTSKGWMMLRSELLRGSWWEDGRAGGIESAGGDWCGGRKCRVMSAGGSDWRDRRGI